MRVAIIATGIAQQEWQLPNSPGLPDFSWHAELRDVEDVDAIVDLQFTPGTDRIAQLQESHAALIVINHVAGNLENLPPYFIRINGWPGFLSGEIVEAAGAPGFRGATEELFALMGKKIAWLEDRPGFISPRVVSMIINEAFIAVEENVSSRAEIDTAMKLGTNYPFGPFEWAEKIGLQRVYELLVLLAGSDERYQPSALLAKEALS
jgi:3-hydroxybutyryl-CoA dehydrogenase